MTTTFDLTSWREFESAQWHQAVRYRGLQLGSLDPEERALVFDAITADLEHRKHAPLTARRISRPRIEA